MGGIVMATTINAAASAGLVTTADTSQILQLQTGGTTAVTIDASQNVGIGTSSPSARLQVTSSGQFSDLLMSTANVTTALFSDSTNLFGVVGTTTNDPFLFYTNNTEKSRFSATGKFGVALDPNGNSGMIQAKAGVGIDTFGGYSSAGAFTFAVSGAGQIYAVSTSIAAISDERLKENIRDLDSGLADVMALKPRLYDWKEGKGADIKNARGFIAQEFEEVFPDLVSGWREPAPEGEEPYKSMRQDLIPTLVKAIQELKVIVDTQAERIAVLEGK